MASPHGAPDLAEIPTDKSVTLLRSVALHLRRDTRIFLAGNMETEIAMLLPDGYSDIPHGKIAAVVTHLEMTAPPAVAR